MDQNWPKKNTKNGQQFKKWSKQHQIANKSNKLILNFLNGQKAPKMAQKIQKINQNTSNMSETSRNSAESEVNCAKNGPKLTIKHQECSKKHKIAKNYWQTDFKILKWPENTKNSSKNRKQNKKRQIGPNHVKKPRKLDKLRQKLPWDKIPKLIRKDQNSPTIKKVIQKTPNRERKWF